MTLDKRTAAGLMLATGIVLLIFAWHFLPQSTSSADAGDWTVTNAGLLEYVVSSPKCSVSPSESDGNSGLRELRFISRGSEIQALLRVPQSGPASESGKQDSADAKGIPGIVLLPGATVSKEREQALAKRLAEFGYATITLDQRNLGGFDAQADLQMFLQGAEPVEHKMVYDALAAAQILRSLPEIDPERIIYAGESNGGRFAIIACALDSKAIGVLAISTCGYDTRTAIASAAASGQAVDGNVARFYLSVDPESYLEEIAPRPFIMIHSLNDTVIPYQMAERTFDRAFQPKRMHTIGCKVHGYCQEMDGAIKEELGNISEV